MLKNKVQIYPPKAGLTTQVNTFPITNILKGSTITTSTSLFSFIHPSKFDNSAQTCAFWYSPIEMVLKNITFQYEVVTTLASPSELQIFVNDSNIANINLLTTVGVQNISLNNMSTNLNFGDSVYMAVKVTSGTYKAFSITAIFSFA